MNLNIFKVVSDAIETHKERKQNQREFDDAHLTLESFAYNYRFFENSPYLSPDEENYKARLDLEGLKAALSFFMPIDESERPFVHSEVSRFFLEDTRGFFEEEDGFKKALHDYFEHGNVTLDYASL